ncbi:NADH dehydrogenase subunit [Gloeothece citriformis PCC 7424]|uniref:NAD(P)H-quinone oxidoreductase subunit L n=1 Tax=Gloeothece citriformis (strain PCC 7424) TaxID=65393 RepID=B7KCY6_GLOC7|nr:NAD(P)H-quinone oxidoreductase subunit L [Gloeothece citriformis]ACK73107.1 NADH dehydrogenase subunit [Gloeothece citriformis PCC 7424]
MEILNNILADETILVALLYLTLSVLYLLIIPGAVYLYLNSRWYVASSFERAFMYFLVFFCFPGLLLLSPILNFRPKRRQLNA